MANRPQTTPNKPKLRRPAFQFSLLGLLLTMTVFCIAAALFSAMFAREQPDDIHVGVVIAACVVPLGLMLAATAVSSLLAWRSRWQQPRQVEDDEVF